jgi:galactose-1-phosphate uridylyltransferase
MAKPKIKTFQDACKALKLDPDRIIPDVSVFPADHQKALEALAKLIIIAQALNGDWKPDWSDYNQGKYYPWFDMEKEQNNPSGFRLYHVHYNSANSAVGSRLCYKSRELAQYAATQFEDLYKDLMVV